MKRSEINKAIANTPEVYLLADIRGEFVSYGGV